jgi:hypothetical protein
LCLSARGANINSIPKEIASSGRRIGETRHRSKVKIIKGLSEGQTEGQGL